MKWNDSVQHGPVYFFNILRVSMCKMLNPLMDYILGVEWTTVSDTDPFINLPLQISALEKSFTDSAMLLGTICEAADEMRQVFTHRNSSSVGTHEKLSQLSRYFVFLIY